jgi:biopolymer transport protein ExbD
MRVPTSHSRPDLSENMMTSMIDVVFLLLIFFLCAATGKQAESLLPTTLAGGDGAAMATARPASALPLDEVWIAVTAPAPGRVVMTLNETPYEEFPQLETVLTQLAEIAPESPVVLDLAPEVPAGELIRLYDTCRRAGFQTINFNVPKT